MENSYSYRMTAYWILAKRGIVSAESVPQAIEFSTPPEFGGEAEMWSPETFFLAAVASCFVSTFRAISEYSKFDSVALDVTVDGKIEKEQGGFRFTELVVRPILTVATDEDTDKGLKLLLKSEAACLISRSLNSKISIEPLVQVSKLVEVK
ncbi:MAG: OsmC family protein [Terriglobia bacterium]|nr:OsmC family protein [Terriglobia bacterium]